MPRRRSTPAPPRCSQAKVQRPPQKRRRIGVAHAAEADGWVERDEWTDEEIRQWIAQDKAKWTSADRRKWGEYEDEWRRIALEASMANPLATFSSLPANDTVAFWLINSKKRSDASVFGNPTNADAGALWDFIEFTNKPIPNKMFRIAGKLV